MKKSIVYLVILSFVCLTNCKKDDTTIRYNPEDLVVKVNASENFFEEDQFYLVIENNKTNPIYIDLQPGETYAVKREDRIFGERVNLHFIFISSFDEDEGSIRSYTDLELGKEFSINPRSGPEFKGFDKVGLNEEKQTVNISFTEIPDFDIVTRSAKHQRHSHTLSTLEVPCAQAGGNTYPVGASFYVCLQKGDNASYKLVPIPSVSDYAISLIELNSDMTKYSIPKAPDYQKAIKVYAMGSEGTIEIFNLFDETLFSGNSVDIFAPREIPEITSFSTLFSAWEKDGFGRFSSYFNYNHVVTEYTLPEMEVTTIFDSGSFPELILSNTEYDYISLTIRPADIYLFDWIIYASNHNSIYSPDFPDVVVEALPSFIQDLFNNDIYIKVDVINDSRFNSYNDAANYILKINSFNEQEEYVSYITTRFQTFNF